MKEELTARFKDRCKKTMIEQEDNVAKRGSKKDGYSRYWDNEDPY